MSRQAVVDLLAASVVYQEGSLVGFNKPPNLAITGKDDLCLTSLLSAVQRRLSLAQELHIVKASSKEHSGLVLLSTCHQTTQSIENAYARRDGKKTALTSYCAVTVGIPEPAMGEISVALTQQSLGEQTMVVPVLNPSAGNFERKKVKKAVTRYRVLDAANGCALVQLQPLTTFQNLLQVHLTLKLCTVLGDHVYSSRVGRVLGLPVLFSVDLAVPRTQVLDEALLQKLHLRREQMHRMPLHLHLHRFSIPACGRKSSETVITAPLPAFFIRTLQLLGLRMKQSA
eukprot:gi/632984949/ref/XP_007909406.1/ PREDICTED: RNA pseudouridylate synthase domain-containing protein 3 [Callorhinchus milii]